MGGKPGPWQACLAYLVSPISLESLSELHYCGSFVRHYEKVSFTKPRGLGVNSSF